MEQQPEDTPPMPEDVRALARALDLLETLRECPMPLTDLAKRCHLSKSTTHRLLSTLRARGYVVQEQGTEMYRLGPSLLGLGSAVASGSDLLRAAFAVMRQLASTTGESVRLGVPHHDEIIVIYHIEGIKSAWSRGPVFYRLPMHCTALGKVILASFPPAEVERIVREKGLASYGPKTINDLPQLQAELERVRQTGYAINDEEHFAGGRAVAAPIRNAQGQVCAALVLLSAADRMPLDSFPNWGRIVIEAAATISAALGWTGISSWTYADHM